MEIIKPNLEYYISRLQNPDPFYFVRYGDGEFEAILGNTTGRNCDGHKYFPALGTELRQSLTINDPNYVYSIGPMALDSGLDNGRNRIQTYLNENDLSIPWHSTEVFLESSIAGKLNPFIKYIRKAKTFYIHPPHLANFAKNQLKAKWQLTIPSHNAYLHIDSITLSAVKIIKNRNPELILVSGGPMAKCLIYRFYQQGIRTNVLDLGSVFDGYVNKHSRSHTRKLTKEIKLKNLAR